MTEKTGTPKKSVAFIKNYILVFSYSPIFLSTVFFALIWGLQYVIYSLIVGSWAPEKLPILIGVATIVTHVIAIYILRSIFIMRPPHDGLLDLDTSMVACGILDKNNSLQIIDGPTWIKGKKYVLRWEGSYKKEINTAASFSIRHQNATAKIPLKLNFEVISWGKLDLLSVATDPKNEINSSVRKGGHYFDMEDILIRGFGIINREKIDEMPVLLAEYMDGTMPTPKFLNSVAESLVAPEEIFGVKVKTTITVKEPIFSATK